jgi:hypothetical protein
MRSFSLLNLTLLALAVTYNSTQAQQNNFFTADPSTNTYIEFGRALNISAMDTIWQSDELTITLWMRWVDKLHSDVGSWANVFTVADSNGSGDNGVFWLQHNSNNAKVEFAIHSTGRDFIQSSTTVTDSVWYHVAAVYNGGLTNNNMRLFINGGQESARNKSGNIRNPPNKSKMNMGRWPNPSNTHREFKGDIDEVSIWNRALTPAEIDSIMIHPESVTALNYDTAGLIGYWDFDDYTANDKTSNHIDGIIFGNNPFGTLPVSLLQFSGYNSDYGVILQWKTANEINNAYFEVQRSSNGLAWQTFQQLSGAGNSNRTVTYTTEDIAPLSGVNLYRLKQVDYNGEFTYSKAIKIDVAKDFEQLGLEITLFNGFNGAGVMIMAEENRSYELDVINMQGQRVYHTTGRAEVGRVNNHMQLDQSLPNGVYIIVLRSEGLTWSAKFNK